jgi:hypothetical protein
MSLDVVRIPAIEHFEQNLINLLSISSETFEFPRSESIATHSAPAPSWADLKENADMAKILMKISKRFGNTGAQYNA